MTTVTNTGFTLTAEPLGHLVRLTVATGDYPLFTDVMTRAAARHLATALDAAAGE